jgi:hypothetical protein
LAVAVSLCTSSLWAQQESVVPADSLVGGGKGEGSVLLISPLASPAGITPAGWKMDKLTVGKTADAKLGAAGVKLGGNASSGGAKGDFTVAGGVGGQLTALGAWMHLADDANVDRVGFQFADKDGEAFLVTRPADWTGWQWVEFDLTAADIAQAYKQDDKNKTIDYPLRGVNVTWFAKAAGPSAVGANVLAAATTEPVPSAPSLIVADDLPPGQTLSLPIVLTHTGDQSATAKVRLELQRDPSLAYIATPEPTRGTDHAAGAASWTLVGDERIESGSLTDLKPRTAARISREKAPFTEAHQIIELLQARTITELFYESQDGNSIWKLDVASSPDGQAWTDVPGLTNVDLNKKWGRQSLKVESPFEAKFLRLRYHKDGEPMKALALLGRLSVYDGIADETWDLPTVGETIIGKDLTVALKPQSIESVAIETDASLPTGAYLASARVTQGDRTDIVTQRLFVAPAPIEGKLEERVGLNTSDYTMAPLHRDLGIGRIRFENMKWRMTSPGPGVYKFDGLLPWGVNNDLLTQTMTEHGIDVLPYLFMSPEWASSGPAESKHRAHYPPTDLSHYGDFVFQTVARYGSKKHDPTTLKTDDKKSGAGTVNTYEIWNEPNLNDPNWGHFVGTMAEYFEMFRVGAEAVKKADPDARVANGGFAGITLDLVDQLRTFKYPDGKSPLDFVDVLSVHTYTGATPTERASKDTNVDRSAGEQGSSVTQEETLRRLDAWRDQHRPNMPIWMSETGFDTGGPRAVSERDQAAYSVRNTLIMLGSGIDAVQIYRDTGSSDGLYAASGLWRNDKSRKPSYYSMATLIRQIHGGGEITRLPHSDPEVYLYGWQRDGAWIVAAWSIGGDKPLALPWGAATVVDSFGSQIKIDDAATLVLTDMPVYLNGIAQTDAITSAVDAGKAQLEQWKQQRTALSNTKTYLFDFGTDAFVGSADIGGPRPYTVVDASDVYNAERGYGFESKPAVRNDDAKWIKDRAERDSARVQPGTTFRADVEPGRYHLQICYGPASQKETLAIEAGGEPKTIEFTRDDKKQSLPIEVTSGSLIVRFPSHGNISYVTLVAE